MTTVDFSRLWRQAVAAVVSLIVAFGIVVTIATPGQAAPPACTTSARFKAEREDVGYPYGAVYVPAVASNSTADCEMLYGQSHSGVRAFQKAFNECYVRAWYLNSPKAMALDNYLASIGYPQFPNGPGPYGAFLAEDGVFGPMTLAAVKGIQFWHNIAIDGRFGKNSRRNMLWSYGAGGATICKPLVYPYALA
jgi:hypothetical protein